MKVLTLLSTGLFVGLFAVSPIQAAGTHWSDWQPDSNPAAEVAAMSLRETATTTQPAQTLGQLESFEMQAMDEPFSGRSMINWPELVDYTQQALQADERLPKASPADGVVELACRFKTYHCDTIEVSVRQGTSGPVVWQTQLDADQWFAPRAWFIFQGQRHTAEMADAIVDALAKAYLPSGK